MEHNTAKRSTRVVRIKLYRRYSVDISRIALQMLQMALSNHLSPYTVQDDQSVLATRADDDFLVGHVSD